MIYLCCYFEVPALPLFALKSRSIFYNFMTAIQHRNHKKNIKKNTFTFLLFLQLFNMIFSDCQSLL